MDKDNFISWDLLEKSFSNQLTTEEEERLLKWLSASAKHREFYNSAIKGGRDVVKGLSQEELRKRKNEFRHMLRLPGTRKSLMWHRITYYAAAVSIIVAVGLPFVLQHKIFSDNKIGHVMKLEDVMPGTSKATIILDDGQEIEIDNTDTTIDMGIAGVTTHNGQLSYRTDMAVSDTPVNIPVINKLRIPKGGEYILMLADSSRIWLNSESIIEYSIEFTSKKREVYLRGEAYFDVAEDHERPFIVRTDDFSAKVTGTTFNVNSYEDMNSSNITVETGNVEVIGVTGETVTLGRNEQLFIDRISGEQSKRNVDAEMVVAWKNGYFDFDMEPLELIAKKISRWYNIETCVSTEALAKTRFSGKIIKYENAGKVLELLNMTGDIAYEIKEGKIILSPTAKK